MILFTVNEINYKNIYFSYSKVLEQKEELEQKHLHVIQILESERQAKWHYVQQTEELATEVKKLKAEVTIFLMFYLSKNVNSNFRNLFSQKWINN